MKRSTSDVKRCSVKASTSDVKRSTTSNVKRCSECRQNVPPDHYGVKRQCLRVQQLPDKGEAIEATSSKTKHCGSSVGQDPVKWLRMCPHCNDSFHPNSYRRHIRLVHPDHHSPPPRGRPPRSTPSAKYFRGSKRSPAGKDPVKKMCPHCNDSLHPCSIRRHIRLVHPGKYSPPRLGRPPRSTSSAAAGKKSTKDNGGKSTSYKKAGMKSPPESADKPETVEGDEDTSLPVRRQLRLKVGKESPAPPPSPSPADAKTTPACKPKKTSRSSTSASRPHDSPKKKGSGRISLKMGKSLSSATLSSETLPEPTELNDDAKVRAPSQMSDTNSSDQTIVLKMEIKIDETDFFQAVKTEVESEENEIGTNVCAEDRQEVADVVSGFVLQPVPVLSVDRINIPVPPRFDKNFSSAISTEDSLICWWMTPVHISAIVHGIDQVGPGSYPPESLEPAYKAYTEGKISGRVFNFILNLLKRRSDDETDVNLFLRVLAVTQTTFKTRRNVVDRSTNLPDRQNKKPV